MTIYTVSSADDIMSEPLGGCVTGSYTTRGRALDECVKYIIERAGLRQDLAWALAHDENHPEAGRFFSERRKDGRTVVRKGCLGGLREFIRDELGGQGCYHVYDGADCTFHFDVDENDVEGTLWTLVTWGDSDCEDPEFTRPFPEHFTSGDAAIRSAQEYLRDLLESRCDESASAGRELERLSGALMRDGEARADLDDGTAVHWVLYSEGLSNVKERA